MNVAFHPKFKPLFAPPEGKDFFAFYGGRGGLKSWGVARFLILEAANHFERILCAREIQNSIAESVHQLLKDQIRLLGLEAMFKATDTSISCPATGSEFLFAGLKVNASKVKSFEGITKVWVEEAAKVSKDSWDKLIPTVLRVAGAKIYVTFNPEERDDPTSEMFIENPRPNALVVKTGWEDNPWLDPKMLAEKDWAYETDPDGAAHVWGGEYKKNSHSQVFKGKYVVEAFEVPYVQVRPGAKALPPDWAGPYDGADWGFSKDPDVRLRCWVDIKGCRLLIEREAYQVGCPLDDIGRLWSSIPDAKTVQCKCDSARPETIFHMAQRGYNVLPAKKWGGSVEDGVTFLKSFKQIVVHPRCKRTAEEFRLYSYKTDRLNPERVLRDIVDKWNHCIDSIRYALDDLICVPEQTMYHVARPPVVVTPEIDEFEAAVGRTI